MNFLSVVIRDSVQTPQTESRPLFDKLRVTRQGVIPHQRLLPELSLSKDKRRNQYDSRENSSVS